MSTLTAPDVVGIFRRRLERRELSSGSEAPSIHDVMDEYGLAFSDALDVMNTLCRERMIVNRRWQAE